MIRALCLRSRELDIVLRTPSLISTLLFLMFQKGKELPFDG